MSIDLAALKEGDTVYLAKSLALGVKPPYFHTLTFRAPDQIQNDELRLSIGPHRYEDSLFTSEQDALNQVAEDCVMLVKSITQQLAQALDAHDAIEARLTVLEGERAGV